MSVCLVMIQTVMFLQVHDDIDKLNVWLDELEPKVPSVISTQAPEELGNALKLFTQLREEISARSGDLRALNNIGKCIK